MAQLITHLEEALLCNFEDDFDVSEEPSHVQQLWQGNWEGLVRNDIVTEILTNYDNGNYTEIFLKHLETDREEIFCSGLACLLSFVQSNFTGPPLSASTVDFLNNDQLKNVDFEKALTVDSEEINVNVKHPELLVLSKYVIENCKLNNSILNAWWYLRYAMIHQQILDECTPTLYSNLEETLKEINYNHLNIRLQSKLYLEISQMYLMYGRIMDADKSINRVKELLAINFELTGQLGIRTKFQQNEIAQVVLRVNVDDTVNRPSGKINIVPQIVKLDDDVRLDGVQITDEQPIPRLPSTEQSTVLVTVQHMQRSRPKDELLREESESYLSLLLRQDNNWTIRFMALLLRCKLEGNHRRTVERSLAQCESLVEYQNKDEPTAIHRICSTWCTAMSPRWKVEAQLADLSLNLGLVKAALDIYLRIQLWEEVIVCYTVLQLRHKAAEVINAQLGVKQTVKLWCLLGDATDDITCYEKAWELSEQKSSRAQRHWGQHLFAHKKYAESIPHFEKSLEINSLQNIVWLRLGFAALEVEDWKLAANAYRRYTSLEPGGFEAWNNLAKAYVNLGEKTRAHFALQEALKYSFDNWKVWDNFMIVSADIGNFADVVRAYNHILDTKETHLDIEILFLLVRSIITSDDEMSQTDAKLLTKTRELFGRLTSLYPNESRLWEMYADLAPNAELKAQRLYRAYRGLVQDDWSKDAVKCAVVLDICQRLGEVSLEAGANSLNTARLTLRAAVSAAKKQDWEQNTDTIASVENVLERIINYKPT